MFNGVFILQTIVLLVNVKIFLATNIHTAWTLFWNIGSVAWFYVFFYVESYSQLNELQGMFFLQMTFVTTFALLLILLAGFSLVDQVSAYVENYIQERIEMNDYANEMSKQMNIQKERQSRGGKLTEYHHKGYDFDGAAGNDMLAYDNITNRI
jgi:hypothetical protein